MGVMWSGISAGSDEVTLALAVFVLTAGSDEIWSSMEWRWVASI